MLAMPVLLAFAFAMLFWYLGLTFFSGIGVFVIAFITTYIVGVYLGKVNRAKMKKTDDRMNITTESFTNIKTLKFYSWVDFYQSEIDKSR